MKYEKRNEKYKLENREAWNFIQYYGNVETGMLPRSHRLFRTRGGRFHLRSRAVLQK